MIDESLLKKHSVGKDGFAWWLGQVCEADVWHENYPEQDVKKVKDLPGFSRRVKVSIFGYHTSSKEDLKNEELPWAYVMLPTTSGGGMGGSKETHQLKGGEWVFGFFLDGEDGQQPVIIGILDKSTQVDFRNHIPNVRFKPFSGFTNREVPPLTDQKRDEDVSKSGTGDLASRGGDGVSVEKKVHNENVVIEGSNYSSKAMKCAYDMRKATGEMETVDNSDCRNPTAKVDIRMKRLQALKQISKKYDGVWINQALNLSWGPFIKNEENAVAGAVAAKTKSDLVKGKAKTLEGFSKATSNLATFTPLSQMLQSKIAVDKSSQKILGEFSSLINELPISSSKFVKETAEKLVSQPPCVTEGYMGGVMGSALGKIDGAMNSAMGDINNVIASVDSLGAFAQQGLGRAKAAVAPIEGAMADAKSAADGLASAVDTASSVLSGGIGGGLATMLTSGLNSIGGISIPLDGLPNFKTSYKKLLAGESRIPCPKAKSFNIVNGGAPESPMGGMFGNVLEKVAADTSAISNLASGISNFTGNNSIFNSLVNLDNIRMDDLGGLGALTDTLTKGKNLASFAKFPGTTGESIIENAMTMLRGGETIDAVSVASNILFPGGGDFVREAFKNQLEGKREQARSGDINTGPVSSGPPLVDSWSGGGTGMLANAVVGDDGQILAMQMKNGGKGYVTAPLISVTDTSGKGRGAIARAILDEDAFDSDTIGGPKGSSFVKEIEIREPGIGYLKKSDGSVGGNGFLFADKHDTVLKDKSGKFYSFEPNTMVEAPPGSEVWFPSGTQVELPTSTMTNNGKDVATEQAKEIANSRSGNRGKGSTAFGYIDYRKLQMMHDFDYSGGKVYTTGQQHQFGAAVDLVRAKAEGYSDADVRYYLESYAVPRLGLRVGNEMQKLLDNPNWGLLPVKLSGGKKPGKIKSLQVVLEQGYKGFQKVTDGSRLGAGPITGLRDAVTDRKISNVLEFQTGNWLNDNAEGSGNADIMEMFRDAELRSIEGTEIEGYGKFGEAGKRTWAQTRQEVGSEFDSQLSGGGVRMNIFGKPWRTLDPWRAGLKAGTKLTFRGLYNHNTALTPEQIRSPYDLDKNNYRYFVFDYEVEVYYTSLGYDYVVPGSVDTVKKAWYKLNSIKYITGTEDWFNGEVVHKRMRDKAGRLYEMHIKVCTDDEDTVVATGGGLNSNSEVMQIVKTAIPCIAPKKEDDWADYQPTRWHREKNGDKTYTESYGHIPGTERNNLVKEIVKVYNSLGDDDNSHLTDFHNAATVKGARKYVDMKGMDDQVKGYLKYLEDLKTGKTCGIEEYTIPSGSTGYNGPGVYLDLRNHPGMQTITFRESVDESRIHHIMEIPGVGTFSEEGNLKWGSADLTQQVTGGRIYGPIKGPRARGVWVGNEVPPHIEKNDLPEGLRNNKNCILEEGSDDFDDFGLSTSVGVFTRFNESPALPSKKGTRRKTTTPLSEEEYIKYSTDFRVIEARAFNCLKDDIWKGFIKAAKTNGPIVKEEVYCDWAQQFVEESKRVYQDVDTISYKLPCGAKFTTPPPVEPPPVPSGPRVPLRPKQGRINSTGSGYTDGDTITCNGVTAEFTTDPDGRIIGFRPPRIPMTGYPVIEINSEFGAGADLEVDLEVGDPLDYPDLDPLQMVEVIDCVGKNIFIVES